MCPYELTTIPTYNLPNTYWKKCPNHNTCLKKPNPPYELIAIPTYSVPNTHWKFIPTTILPSCHLNFH